MEMLTLRSCVWESFKKTEELKYASISVPAISSGIFKFPKDLCAEIIFETALDWFKGNPTHLKEIRFTNFDKATVDFFTKEFVKRFDKNKSGKDVIVEAAVAVTVQAVPALTSAPAQAVASPAVAEMASPAVAGVSTTQATPTNTQQTSANTST